MNINIPDTMAGSGQVDIKEIIRSKARNNNEWTENATSGCRRCNLTQENAVKTLLRMLEIKDQSLYAHSLHVTEIGLLLAQIMELSKEQTDNLRLGGLLHDIGKIATSGNILNKKGKLNILEYSEIKNHPVVGAAILKELNFDKHISDIVLQHHERIDGKGYPAGVSGPDIYPEARIIAVADSYDALIADRIYRKGLPQAEAVELLRQESGLHYDADVVDAFITKVLSLLDRPLSAG
jgi:uncharacterized domain HDIG